MSDQGEDHECIANLSNKTNQVVEDGSAVYLYKDCKVCGEEYEIEYEYVEAVPA